MNSTQPSTQYTAMYNTFKTYIHGKDIDTSYNLDLNKEKEKSKTAQDFHTNEINKSTDKLSTSENNFISNYLIHSSDSKNNFENNDNIKKYEMARYGPMQRITEDDRENEETFQNEEPKFYDEYDEQYVIKYFNLISFLEKYYLLELQNCLCRRKNLGKSDLSKM